MEVLKIPCSWSPMLKLLDLDTAFTEVSVCVSIRTFPEKPAKQYKSSKTLTSASTFLRIYTLQLLQVSWDGSKQPHCPSCSQGCHERRWRWTRWSASKGNLRLVHCKLVLQHVSGWGRFGGDSGRGSIVMWESNKNRSSHRAWTLPMPAQHFLPFIAVSCIWHAHWSYAGVRVQGSGCWKYTHCRFVFVHQIGIWKFWQCLLPINFN